SFYVVLRLLLRSSICPYTTLFRSHRQQSGREPDSALGIGALELAVCRFTTQRQTGGCDHEPDPVSTPQRSRSVRLPEGRAHAATNAAGKRNQSTAAASVDTA